MAAVAQPWGLTLSTNTKMELQIKQAFNSTESNHSYTTQKKKKLFVPHLPHLDFDFQGHRKGRITTQLQTEETSLPM